MLTLSLLNNSRRMKAKTLVSSMTLPSFALSSVWRVCLLSILWSCRVVAQATSVNITMQDDPHFIGWYIGPSTSETPHLRIRVFRDTHAGSTWCSRGNDGPSSLDNFWALCPWVCNFRNECLRICDGLLFEPDYLRRWSHS